jgi:hypothetical protein
MIPIGTSFRDGILLAMAAQLFVDVANPPRSGLEWLVPTTRRANQSTAALAATGGEGNEENE